MLEHHPLVKEFPELTAKLHELKTDAHCVKLMTKYDELDKEVFRLESSGEFTDAQIENLKKERLSLKDIIYTYLQK